MNDTKKYELTSRGQNKRNLLDYPTFPTAGIPADVGIYRGVRIGTGVVAGITVVLVQVGSKSRSRELLASVSVGWLSDSLLVERKRGSVEETRAHLRVRKLQNFRLSPLVVVGPEGGRECGDRVSQGREFHFLSRDLGDVIPDVWCEEFIIVLRVAGFIH